MKKIILFSALLLIGLVGSQILPSLIGASKDVLSVVVVFFTMVGLSFIMIHVGYEFDLDKKNIRSYGWDYVVAMTTAGLPWIFASLYFAFVMMPQDYWFSGTAWKEVLIAGRFAAPTATGLLFAMLAAAGLTATWMYQKTRILVIFDDLDTVLLMIPLKILMVGLAWQLGVVVVLMLVQLWIAWRWLHRVPLPVSWPWVLIYSFLIAGISEAVYVGTKTLDDTLPIHVEVLLPAFVLGCIMKRPASTDLPYKRDTGGQPEVSKSESEERVSTVVSSAFMFLVGLSMPSLFGAGRPPADSGLSDATTLTAGMAPLEFSSLLLHIFLLTLLINLGKMFPALCYRRQAHWKERLAVAIGMCPRGEVGAGIILLSLSYGIGGPIVSVAVMSLALNLLLTPVFVYAINHLVRTANSGRFFDSASAGDQFV